MGRHRLLLGAHAPWRPPPGPSQDATERTTARRRLRVTLLFTSVRPPGRSTGRALQHPHGRRRRPRGLPRGVHRRRPPLLRRGPRCAPPPPPPPAGLQGGWRRADGGAAAARAPPPRRRHREDRGAGAVPVRGDGPGLSGEAPASGGGDSQEEGGREGGVRRVPGHPARVRGEHPAIIAPAHAHAPSLPPAA